MTKQKSLPFGLPKWIDPVIFAAFEEMRNKLKKPMTDFAKQLIVDELAKCKAIGDDANECLKRSIRSSWTDVYPRKPFAEQPDDEPPPRTGAWARKLG